MGETQLVASVRDMLLDDLEVVLAIDHASYAQCCTLGELVHTFNKPAVVGLVAEFQDVVVGFLLYERTRSLLCLMDVAIEPGFRRMGVGTQLLRKLISRLKVRRQPKIACLVDEGDMDVHLFLRSCGFLATHVLLAKDRVAETDEDAYAFEYDLEYAPGAGVSR